MSSYNQVADSQPLAEMLSAVRVEVLALEEELADLCATIAARFPDTHPDIPKYQQAATAHAHLDEAKALLDGALDGVQPSYRTRTVTATVGKQTRQGRASSQRVRLGNAVARLRAVTEVLEPDGAGPELADRLESAIGELEGVTFPKAWG